MKRLITVILAAFAVSASANTKMNLSEIRDYMNNLKTNNCQIEAEIYRRDMYTDKLGIKLLNRSTAEDIFFNATTSYFSDPVITVTKSNGLKTFTYRRTLNQSSFSSLESYYTFTVVSDAQNRLKSVKFVQSEDERGMFRVKVKVVKSFECKE